MDTKPDSEYFKLNSLPEDIVPKTNKNFKNNKKTVKTKITAPTKVTTKTKKVTSKKTRHSDLIFVQNKADGDENKKPRKGSLREIIIDGNNCALASVYYCSLQKQNQYLSN